MIEKDFIVSEARIWNALEGAEEPLSSILAVRDGRIRGLGPVAASPPSATGLGTVSLPGRVIVPGLIDAHVHLELDPGLRSPAEQLAVPLARRRAAMARRAVEMLAAGITTARDCGGGFHDEHRLSAQIRAGECRGPRLLCCGQPLTTPGGHCAFWGGEVSTPAEIERMVAVQREAGSDWIKVIATGGVFTPGSRARDAQFDLAGLVSVVEAAGRDGLPVAAHCHGTEGIARAVRAGVRTIEHASFAGPQGFGTSLDRSLMREMADRALWVSPTVNAGWGRRARGADGVPSDFFERMSRLLRTQRDHGIRFIASTDAGIPGVLHQELVAGLLAFSDYAGLRPVEALRAATSESALALGIAEETGTLQPGRSADFLVLEGNPLEDLRYLIDPEFVVFRGEWLDRARRRSMLEEARRIEAKGANA